VTPRETYQRALTWAWKQAWLFPGVFFEANISTAQGLLIIVVRVDEGIPYLRTWREKRR
jgi:hypothetical protein